MGLTSRISSRGIEVLIKKAAVDPEFRALLMERRGEAARKIGLELNATEAVMLGAIPREHLEKIIDQTEVAPESRRVFLGMAAAAMVAALGVGYACFPRDPTLGIRPGSEKYNRILLNYLESSVGRLEVQVDELSAKLQAQQTSATTSGPAQRTNAEAGERDSEDQP